MSTRPLFAFGAATILAFAALFFSACKNDPKPKIDPATQQDPELAALSNLLERDPENDSLLYRRAQAYYRLDGYDEALADLGQAIYLDSVQPAYYHLMADVLLDYARPNDSRRAIEVLKMAAAKFPNRFPTLLKLSEFYLIVRMHNEALATLQKILERDPQNAEAFFMTGRVALDMGDTARSVVALQKSVQFDAQNIDAWVFLGRIFSNRDNPLAVQYFDNALRIDSTSLEAREFKGAFYKRRGEFDKAFEIYRDILRLNPDYANAYFDIGMIYIDKDSLDKAYDNFDIAIKTDPLFVKAYYYRGLTSELMGKIEAAREDYTQASKMSPNYADPKAALERISKKK